MRKIISTIVVFIFVIGCGAFTYRFWPYIFSKNVTGVISDVQRVALPTVVVGGGAGMATSREMFSFAIAIKQKDGEIATASSEDRQWAVAKPGLCVEAKFLRYPPWELDKAGSYYGARMGRLYVCDEGRIIDPALQSEPLPTTEGQ